jgi:hypothetical protein
MDYLEEFAMNKPVQLIALGSIVSLAALAAIAYAYDPPPDSVAQPGDPARWYKPADTPQKQYHAAMKEANAALKIAMTDCRREAKSDRSACFSDAMRTYHEDVAAANSLRTGS